MKLELEGLPKNNGLTTIFVIEIGKGKICTLNQSMYVL